MKSRILNLIWASVGLIVWLLMCPSQSDARLDSETAVGVWLLNENTSEKVKDISGHDNHGEIQGAK